MAEYNPLEKYGIKEVADVFLYELDGEERGAPVLYFDTLKVSTIEQTAETTEARGGKGNPLHIVWDYNKEINITLQDALFSGKSMEIMMGATAKAVTTLEKTILINGLLPEKWTDALGNEHDTTGAVITNLEGGVGTAAVGVQNYATFDITVVGKEMEITADKFPGTYYLVGETYARSAADGKDQFFQFVVPKAKLSVENSITLEAEGDPTVFDMSLRVLRPAGEGMMKLVQYSIPE